MKISLAELEEFSGEKVRVYSILIDEGESTLFDQFLEENENDFNDEIQDIINRIQVMAEHTGVRDDFIKQGEGDLGDGICALYDKPESKLRLYFIRFGNVAIVLGGGGHKPKNIRRLQENSKLKDENYLLRKVSAALNEAVQDGSLFIKDDGFESLTDFTYTIDEDE